MYDRYQQWKDAEIASQAESLWTNTIVSALASVDFRVMLRGYGWVKDNDTALPVLYEGRYQCYFREAGDTTWTRFATVVSERETSGESRVYKDTFVELGKSDELVYEFKIVAADAAKYTAYSGGSLENIEADEQLWYDAKMRLGEPNSAIPDELIFVSEYVSVAPDVLYLAATDFVVVDELVAWGVYYPVGISEDLVTFEVFSGEIVLPLGASEDITVVEDFETFQDWVNVGTPAEVLPVVEDLSIFLDETHLSVYETPWVWEIVSLAYDILEVSVYDEVTVSESLAYWTEPPWRIPAVEDFNVQEVVTVEPLAYLYFDDCSSVSGWTSQSTGTGSFVSDSGSFLLTGDGLDNIGQRLRSTGVDLQRYYSLKFKYKVDSGDGSLVIVVGSDRLRFRFTLVQDQAAAGDLVLNNGTTFEGIFDARATWEEIELQVLEECDDGDGFLVDVYVGGFFQGRGFAEHRTSGSVGNGQIQIGTTGSTDGTARIDDIELLLLEQSNYRYVWKRDDDTSTTTDITVEENVSLLPFVLPYNIGVGDDLSIAEDATLVGLFLVDKFETLFVLEDVQLTQNPLLLSVEDGIGVTDIESVLLDVRDVDVFETVSVVENVVADMLLEIDVFEDLTSTVVENVSLDLLTTVSVYEEPTVIEDVVLQRDLLLVSIDDDILVTEVDITLIEYGGLFVVDAVTILENVQNDIEILADVFDAVAIVENFELRFPGVYGTELVAVTEDFAYSLTEFVWYEPCDDFDDWSKQETNGATISISPAGQFFYDSPGVSANEYCHTYRNTAVTNPALYEVEARVKIDKTDNGFDFMIRNGNHGVWIQFLSGNGGTIKFNNGPSATGLWSTGEWHTYRFVITAPSHHDDGSLCMCDLYVDGDFVTTFVEEVNLSEGTADFITMWVRLDDQTNRDREVHVDWMQLTTRRIEGDIYRGEFEDVSVDEYVSIGIDKSLEASDVVAVSESVSLLDEMVEIGVVIDALSVTEDIVSEVSNEIVFFEDCDDLSAWSKQESNGGTVTISPAGQFRYYCPGSSGYEHASSWRSDAFTNPALYELELRLKLDIHGSTMYARVNNGNFEGTFKFLYDYFPTLMVGVQFGNKDFKGFPSVGLGEWHVWKFVVTATGDKAAGLCVADVYIDGQYKITLAGENNQSEGSDDQLYTELTAEGAASASEKEMHLDYILLTSRVESGIIYRGRYEDVDVTENVSMAVV